MQIGAGLPLHDFKDFSKLPYFEGLDVQLQLFKYKEVEEFLNSNALAELINHNINIISIHAPGITFQRGNDNKGLLDDLSSIKTFQEGHFKFTSHPQKRGIPSPQDLGELSDYCQKMGYKLCWEMFGRKRGDWCRLPTNIKDLTEKYLGFGFTFDTSHADDPCWMQNPMWTFLAPKVDIIHLSAKPKVPLQSDKYPSPHGELIIGEIREHCPIYLADPVYDIWDFLHIVRESKWDGMIFLEYMPNFDNCIKSDVKALREFFNEKELE